MSFKLDVQKLKENGAKVSEFIDGDDGTWQIVEFSTQDKCYNTFKELCYKRDNSFGSISDPISTSKLHFAVFNVQAIFSPQEEDINESGLQLAHEANCIIFSHKNKDLHEIRYNKIDISYFDVGHQNINLPFTVNSTKIASDSMIKRIQNPPESLKSLFNLKYGDYACTILMQFANPTCLVKIHVYRQ